MALYESLEAVRPLLQLFEIEKALVRSALRAGQPPGLGRHSVARLTHEHLTAHSSGESDGSVRTPRTRQP